MATVKIKFRSSSVDGREGTVYYQVIHKRVARQINTPYKLFPAHTSYRIQFITSTDKENIS
mgnify:CR=1 FL=1